MRVADSWKGGDGMYKSRLCMTKECIDVKHGNEKLKRTVEAMKNEDTRRKESWSVREE